MAFCFRNTPGQVKNGKPKNKEEINKDAKHHAATKSAKKSAASYSRRARVIDVKKKICVQVEKTDWSAVVAVWLGSFIFLTPRYPKKGWGIRESITRP